MEIIIKCAGDELFDKEFEVFEKVIITFENKGNVMIKNMIVTQKDVAYFKDKKDLKFELIDYTEIQRSD